MMNIVFIWYTFNIYIDIYVRPCYLICRLNIYKYEPCLLFYCIAWFKDLIKFLLSYTDCLIVGELIINI